MYGNFKDAYSLEKRETLTAAASDYSASLSDLGLDFKPHVSDNYSGIKRRVIVFDTCLNVVFDSSQIENTEGKRLVLPASVAAIRGNDYFLFDIDADNESFESLAASTVISDGKTIGAVCVFESDLTVKKIVAAYEASILIIGIITFILLMLLGIFIAFLLIRRISAFRASIANNKGLDDAAVIPITRDDEFTPIIREFNDIYERLIYIQQMRQAFVSDASHELRTPLAATKLLCDSITQTDEMDTETVKEFMSDIVLEVDRMSHTAEKLLVLSKLDNSSSAVLAPISLSDIVDNMVTSLTPIAEDKNVRIELYAESECSILGDIEGANQIIGNLIDNAIKYNNVGGVLRIYLFSKNGKCTFITDDTGIGIAPEFREHVFERFYRVDKSRKHDGRGGSGLGLAIVKRNVEAFGGTISISDSVHGGTRFTVVFPSLLSDEEAKRI